jgi:hypothetical protein
VNTVSNEKLWKSLLNVMQANLTLFDLTSVIIARSYQYSQQGIERTPFLHVHQLQEQRYGYQKRNSYWDSINSQMVHEESIWMRSQMQIGVFAGDKPLLTSLAQFNALNSNLAHKAAMMLQSDNARLALRSLGYGISRIGVMPFTYQADEREKNYAEPILQFYLDYQETVTLPEVAIDTIIGDIHAV